MPRNRVARRSFQRGSASRLTEWIGLTYQTNEKQLAAGTFVVESSLNALALAKRPFTITRTVGLIAVRSDQSAGVESPFGAVGMMVVSDKAVATGATAIPDPVTQVSSDEWFLYQTFLAAGNSDVSVGQVWLVFQFDSRAQRKVVDGEDFVSVIANANATDGLSYIFQQRVLVKLS